MKKKRIMISLICLVVVVFALMTFLIVASNYKKTYVLNKTDYAIGINPKQYYGLDQKVLDYYKEKKQQYIEGKDFEVVQQVDLFIYDKTHTTRDKNIKCTKSKYIRGNKNTEHNANVYMYGYIEYEIPRMGHYEFVEYPLWKTKNCLYVTYYFED